MGMFSLWITEQYVKKMKFSKYICLEWLQQTNVIEQNNSCKSEYSKVTSLQKQAKTVVE